MLLWSVSRGLVACVFIEIAIGTPSEGYPCNNAYYKSESNSFFAICRLTPEQNAKCDFLIDLNEMDRGTQSQLFGNQSPEQWALIRSNRSHIEQLKYSSSNVSSSQHIIDKLKQFPSDFNSDAFCFKLAWETYYNDVDNKLQFRVLMTSEFQQAAKAKKCVLHPWSLVSPQSSAFFGHSSFSFDRNFIEIRFSPINGTKLTMGLLPKLKTDVLWSELSLEITHIYTVNNTDNTATSRSANPTFLDYFFLIDLTDGRHRWWLWKTKRNLEIFLNDTFESIAHQWVNFLCADTFAQITSMLLTNRARLSHGSNSTVEVLTTPDNIKKRVRGDRREVAGNFNWNSNREWNTDKLQIKRLFPTMLQKIDGQSDLMMDVHEFALMTGLRASQLDREVPEPPAFESGSASVSPFTGPMNSPFLTAEQHAELLMSFNSYHSAVVPIAASCLQVLRSSPRNAQSKPSALFKVRPARSRSARLHSRTIIDQMINAQPPVAAAADVSTTEDSASTSRLPTATESAHPAVEDAEYHPVDEQDSDENVQYIILYEGNNYGQEAAIISISMFIISAIVSCIGFACIILEQTRIRRRRSASSSSTSVSKQIVP